MKLMLQTTRREAATVIACKGRIVFGEETATLSKTVRELLPDSPRIVLHLGEVKNIDSGGLGALVGLTLSARRAGGDVKLCQVSPRVSHLLEITRLRGVLEVFPTPEEAVAAFHFRTAAA